MHKIACIVKERGMTVKKNKNINNTDSQKPIKKTTGNVHVGTIQNDDMYKTLIEHSSDGIFLAINYKFVYANPALVKIVGASSLKSLKDKNILDFLIKKF